MAHTSVILPDFCLNNYTLVGIMKSTPIFSMLCHNTKICIRLFTCTEIFADAHMPLKLHFTVTYFFTTVNKSVYMHSRNIYK